ncbi:hypothetical protein NPIL_200971 [Nephila pilipes]|uniref:Uncharacterized protein n=1 Tax=Nephila pilipes TaxID=299642 RepID=A0A8X6TI47_NEPPI|nr:hypothetical protein NPIL_200971 [Nephila pilipes]
MGFWEFCNREEKVCGKWSFPVQKDSRLVKPSLQQFKETKISVLIQQQQERIKAPTEELMMLRRRLVWAAASELLESSQPTVRTIFVLVERNKYRHGENLTVFLIMSEENWETRIWQWQMRLLRGIGNGIWV